MRTRARRYGHVILLGGGRRPSCVSVSVASAEDLLAEAGLATNIMVDCSSAKSGKNLALRSLVLENCTGRSATAIETF